MVQSMVQGAVLMRGRCPHCNASMLLHDGTLAEITCQMCSRVWECGADQPGHEHCIHQYRANPAPEFPEAAYGSGTL